MPETIQCPGCKRKLRVPDELIGKKVKCPSCSSTFAATIEVDELPEAPLEDEPPRKSAAGRRAAPRDEEDDYEEVDDDRPAARRGTRRDDDEDEDEPRPRRRPARYEEEEEDEYDDEEEERPRRQKRKKRGDRREWQKVSTGLALVLVSVILLVVVVLVALVGGMIVGGMAGANPQALQAMQKGQIQQVGGGMRAFMVVVGILQLISHIVSLVGYGFCAAAPARENVKTLAMVTLGLAVFAFLFSLVGQIIDMTGGAGQANPMAMGGGGAAGIVGMVAGLLHLGRLIAFIFFLKSVARCFRDWSVEKTANGLLIVVGCLIACIIGLVISAFAVGAAALGAVAQGGQPGAALGGGAIMMASCGCITILVALTFIVWYIVALVRTRSIITTRLGL